MISKIKIRILDQCEFCDGEAYVFAVGNKYAGYGTIVHYDGTDWSAMSIGSEIELKGVWGSGPSDIFAVGFGGTYLNFLPLTLKG